MLLGASFIAVLLRGNRYLIEEAHFYLFIYFFNICPPEVKDSVTVDKTKLLTLVI